MKNSESAGVCDTKREVEVQWHVVNFQNWQQVLFASAVCICSSHVLFASALRKCSSQVLFASALHKCSLHVLFASALCKCSLQVLFAYALCKCSLQVLVASALRKCSLYLCRCSSQVLFASALCRCSLQVLFAGALGMLFAMCCHKKPKRASFFTLVTCWSTKLPEPQCLTTRSIWKFYFSRIGRGFWIYDNTDSYLIHLN
jgi:hypothetical protein